MKIYVMRHGETVWNAKGITQGRSNNRLSKNGKIQAEMTAEKLKSEKIDLIVCSPLMRTVQTANIMNQYHGVKILKNENINEVDQGIFTGRLFKSLSEEEKKIKSQRSKSCGMESVEEVTQRAKKFIFELKQNYLGKKVLVVTHNLVACAIESIAKFGDFDDSYFRNKVNFANAELKEIEI
ncbi:MAG: histidine phosphatase family protein [Clostridia bacterium]|nr:histidine phosphatase family protein [Clostridia bacterium]